VTVLRRHYQRLGPVRRALVDLDALVREQEPQHLDVTVLQRDYQRRGPVLRDLVDLDVLAREQEPHNLDVAVLRRAKLARLQAAQLTRL
jgi:hypothetical protein